MPGNSKTKRKSAGVKKRLISKTPLSLNYDADGALVMKTMPYNALEKFKARNATRSDWETIAFRVMVTVEMCSLFKEEEPVEISRKAMAVIDRIRERSIRMNGQWGAGDLEIEDVRKALELADTMQDTLTRREQLPIYLKVDNLLKSVVLELLQNAK